MLCQSKPHENPTNRGSEDIHNSQNFNWGRESHNICFRRSESLQSVGLKSRMDKLTKHIYKSRPSVDSWEVATAQKLKKWKHLSCVTDEVIKDDQNINVELLIGANCARALEPIKVIPSRNDGPYAMKTILGWCIVGPISYRNQSEGKISCNRTAVMEAGSNKVSRHYFAVENKLKPDG